MVLVPTLAGVLRGAVAGAGSRHNDVRFIQSPGHFCSTTAHSYLCRDIYRCRSTSGRQTYPRTGPGARNEGPLEIY